RGFSPPCPSRLRIPERHRLPYPRLRPFLFLAHPVLPQPPIQRLPIQPQHLRRLRPPPTDRLEHPQDVPPLDLLQREQLLVLRAARLHPTGGAQALGQVVDRHLVEGGERDRSLDDV